MEDSRRKESVYIKSKLHTSSLRFTSAIYFFMWI